MTTTNHPLTDTAAAELWDEHIPGGKVHYIGWGTFPEPTLRHFTAIIRAAYDAGREHERERTDPFHDPRPWQDCTREDICAGDLVEARRGYMLYTGVAHRRDMRGNWYTKLDYPLSYDDEWTLRRIPAPTPPAEVVELPTEFGAVITNVEDNNGQTYDRMLFDGTCYCHKGMARALEDVWAFTLPDGTRARRDGDSADGTPRFVKEDA